MNKFYASIMVFVTGISFSDLFPVNLTKLTPHVQGFVAEVKKMVGTEGKGSSELPPITQAEYEKFKQKVQTDLEKLDKNIQQLKDIAQDMGRNVVSIGVKILKSSMPEEKFEKLAQFSQKIEADNLFVDEEVKQIDEIIKPYSSQIAQYMDKLGEDFTNTLKPIAKDMIKDMIIDFKNKLKQFAD